KILHKLRGAADLGSKAKHITLAQKESADWRVAQVERRPNQRRQDRLQVERRTTDDLQHVGGRDLLLQRLRKIGGLRLHLVEQPDVFDGDHGLVGKGRDQFDLFFCKGTRLASVQ